MVYRCAKCTKNGGQNKFLVEAIQELQDEEKQFSALKDSVKSVEEKIIPEIRQDLDDIKSEHAELKSDFDNHVESNAIVIQEIKDQLSENLVVSADDNVDSNSSTLPNAALQTQAILSEIDNRKSRENNIII